MSDSFPAAPGTRLVIAPTDGGQGPTFIPVVGWINTKGARVAALTAQHGVPFRHGVAVIIPGVDDELVQDPTYQQTFESISGWLEFLGSKKAPNSRAELKPDTADGIIFDPDKTYVKTSYWHFRKNGEEFLFEVDGGNPLPDDARVTKTNRRDFMQLKKTVTVLRVDGSCALPEAVDADLESDVEDLV